jgi:protein-S-isoprenylcysteine O-methyltransferase Ste14
MKEIVVFVLAALLLLCAYFVFRILVRRAYAAQGRLSAPLSGLQLLIFLGFFCFPYLYNPPEWGNFWQVSKAPNPALAQAGLIIICAGLVGAFGTMAWFGLKQAFGVANEGLTQSGPYRFSRNPQILGGYLMVIGCSLQWPSLYSLGWILMYALIMHWMVITEEEHLRKVYGEAYETYCSEVPRYLF